MRYYISTDFCFCLYSSIFYRLREAFNDLTEKGGIRNGKFLIGVVLISVLSGVLSMMMPESRKEEFGYLAKLAAGMWLLLNIFSFLRL